MDSIKIEHNLVKSNHFVYCKNGFESDFILVDCKTFLFTHAKVSDLRIAFLNYVDFYDLHSIKIESYVNDTLLLIKTQICRIYKKIKFYSTVELQSLYFPYFKRK